MVVKKPKDKGTDVSKEFTAAKPPKLTEITRDSISALGSKLDKFSGDLTEDEQVTLSTLFALAAKGFQTFPGSQSCSQDLRIGVGEDAVSVERLSAGSLPKLSETLSDAFCPGKASRFSIEGLEVERSMFGAKSVAARACRGFAAKSVAAQAVPGELAAKSVAARACRGSAAKSVAAQAACRGFAAKSVAAQAACRGFAAKSVAAQAACRGFAAKSVAAQAACRGFAAKSVAAQATCRGFAAKSVAAQGACRGFAAKSVAAY